MQRLPALLLPRVQQLLELRRGGPEQFQHRGQVRAQTRLPGLRVPRTPILSAPEAPSATLGRRLLSPRTSQQDAFLHLLNGPAAPRTSVVAGAGGLASSLPGVVALRPQEKPPGQLSAQGLGFSNLTS